MYMYVCGLVDQLKPPPTVGGRAAPPLAAFARVGSRPPPPMFSVAKKAAFNTKVDAVRFAEADVNCDGKVSRLV